MTSKRTIVGTVLAVLLAYFLGPLGGLLFLSLLFGLTLSNYQRTKKIQEDLQLIKEKLGIATEEDFEKVPVSDEEIERELEEHAGHDRKE
ncbi:hypothetical protein WMW72_07145 [Paenibacillus filicis]|uniref:Uncharacterized protein n=1 Tax=Paenibacillus filicis TaxID=669464 RepID=A0ABU9DHQ5_9BACL